MIVEPETSEYKHWWEQEHKGRKIDLEMTQLAEVRLLKNSNLFSLTKLIILMSSEVIFGFGEILMITFLPFSHC